MFRTDDPIADFHSYDAEQEKQLKRLPKCEWCNEHIQDDYYYEIADIVICEECLNDEYRKSTDDYLNRLED